MIPASSESSAPFEQVASVSISLLFSLLATSEAVALTWVVFAFVGACSGKPSMVYVFPEPVCPYAKIVQLYPRSTSASNGDTTVAKIVCCEVAGPNTRSKVYVRWLSLCRTTTSRLPWVPTATAEPCSRTGRTLTTTEIFDPSFSILYLFLDSFCPNLMKTDLPRVHTQATVCVSWASDGSLLASASADSTVCVFDCAGVYRCTLLGHSAGINAVCFAQSSTARGDRRYKQDSLNTSGGSMENNTASTKQNSTETSTQSNVQIETNHNNATSNSIVANRLDLVIGTNENSIHGQKKDTSENQNSHSDSKQAIDDKNTTNSKYHILASASDDCTIRIWPITAFGHQSTVRDTLILEGHTAPVLCIAFAPNTRIIASGSQDETVRIWDLTNSVCLRSLPAHSDPVTSISFVRDGSLLVSCSYDGIKIVDWRTYPNMGYNHGSVSQNTH